MAATVDIRAMLRKFGVVTVMNVNVYKAIRFTEATTDHSVGEWDSVSTLSAEPLFYLDTLKIANINSEGPTKSITGGQNADVLLKYGKTFTIEMQDALGRYDVLYHIFGIRYNKDAQIAAITDRFPGELTIVGSTFVIDQATGAKQPINVIIPLFLGDGIFNLTQDAEGDASVFDLNGSLLKFNGIDSAAGTTAIDTIVTKDTETAENGNGTYYAESADNEFYFLCTAEALTALKTKEYAKVYANGIDAE